MNISNTRIILIVVLALLVIYEAFQLNLSSRQMDVLNSHVSSLSGERESYRFQLDKSHELADDLEGMIREKEEQIVKTAAELQDLRVKLAGAADEAGNLTGKLQSAEEAKADLEEKLKSAQKELKNSKRAQRQAIKEKTVQLSASLRASNSQLAEIKKRLDTAEKTCQMLVTNNQTLAESNRELESTRLKLSEEYQDARDQLVKLSQELGAQNKSLEDANVSNQALRKQVEQLSGVLTKRELELASREEEVKDLKDKATGLETKKSELETKLAAIQEQQKKAANLFSEVMQINASLEDKLNQFSSPEKEEGEKEETENLKRKVEVILNTDNP